MKEEPKMNFLKRHADAATVIGLILTAGLWMRSEFKEIHSEFKDVHKEIAGLKQDMGVIKAVLIMKNIMPTELARREKIVDCEHGMD
jgi:hypothetical protein